LSVSRGKKSELDSGLHAMLFCTPGSQGVAIGIKYGVFWGQLFDKTGAPNLLEEKNVNVCHSRLGGRTWATSLTRVAELKKGRGQTKEQVNGAERCSTGGLTQDVGRTKLSNELGGYSKWATEGGLSVVVRKRQNGTILAERKTSLGGTNPRKRGTGGVQATRGNPNKCHNNHLGRDDGLR